MEKLKGDFIALALSGSQVPVPECNLVITQPTIKQVAAFGETNFLMAVSLIGRTEDFVKDLRAGNSQLEILPTFQLLLIMIEQDVTAKKAVLDFFELIFPDYEVSVEVGMLAFKIDGKMVGQLNPMNFEALQEVIFNLFAPRNSDPRKDDYNPVNDKAREIAEKMRRGREIIAEQKSKNSGDKNTSIIATFTSVLSIGLGIDVNTFYNYTLFQLYDSFERYFAKDTADFYRKVSTTPLMDTSKMETPAEWTRNLYS
jgi:hypothetical protein